MATSIRDRARKGRRDAYSKPSTPPEAEVEVEDNADDDDADELDTVDRALEAESDDTTEDSEALASVTAITDAAVDRLTEEEIEAFLAQQASGPMTAGLVATRETKTSQIQYDGKTEDGYVVRVWAPPGAPMIIKANLVTPE